MSNTHEGKVRVEFRPEEAKVLLLTAWEILKEKQEPEEVDPSLVGAFVKLGRGLDRLKPPLEAVGSRR
ncbi:hypothetical protein ES703_114000 [subsurface metagenome]